MISPNQSRDLFELAEIRRSPVVAEVDEFLRQQIINSTQLSHNEAMLLARLRKLLLGQEWEGE
jgi:hypothetical protein